MAYEIEDACDDLVWMQKRWLQDAPADVKRACKKLRDYMERLKAGGGVEEGGERLDIQAAPIKGKIFPGTGFIEYPFPIRKGQNARLVLPRDLTRNDVKRITAFLKALVPAPLPPCFEVQSTKWVTPQKEGDDD